MLATHLLFSPTALWSGTSGGSNGTHYAGGKIGTYAGYFDGSTNNVSLGNPTALQATSSISVVAWVNPSTIVGGDNFVSDYWNSSGPIEFEVYSGNRIACTILNGSESAFSPLNSFTQSGAWQQVGCTWDGATISVFLNGVKVGTSPAMGTLSNGSGCPWYIGAVGTSGFVTGRFSGLIDDARIYNCALPAAEVKALYDAEH